MIYADKEKTENQYVSVNSIARGRILQRKEVLHGINSRPSLSCPAAIQPKSGSINRRN